jgi:hypothetical protein
MDQSILMESLKDIYTHSNKTIKDAVYYLSAIQHKAYEKQEKKYIKHILTEFHKINILSPTDFLKENIKKRKYETLSDDSNPKKIQKSKSKKSKKIKQKYSSSRRNRSLSPRRSRSRSYSPRRSRSISTIRSRSPSPIRNRSPSPIKENDVNNNNKTCWVCKNLDIIYVPRLHYSIVNSIYAEISKRHADVDWFYIFKKLAETSLINNKFEAIGLYIKEFSSKKEWEDILKTVTDENNNRYIENTTVYHYPTKWHCINGDCIFVPRLCQPVRDNIYLELKSVYTSFDWRTLENKICEKYGYCNKFVIMGTFVRFNLSKKEWNNILHTLNLDYLIINQD